MDLEGSVGSKREWRGVGGASPTSTTTLRGTRQSNLAIIANSRAEKKKCSEKRSAQCRSTPRPQTNAPALGHDTCLRARPSLSMLVHSLQDNVNIVGASN